LRLQVSIRQKDDPQFSSFLGAIGDDHVNDTVDLSRLRHTQSLQHLIDFVFPPAVVADPMICISRAIFNAFVDEFNTAILRTVPEESRRYISNDSIEGDSDSSNEAILADPEFLNSLDDYSGGYSPCLHQI
jgi:hypothetical protein